MAGYHCIAILCLLAVTVSAQDPVNCYANDNCDGTSPVLGVTRESCCSNLLDPVGFSVRLPGLEGCQRCPIVVGFSPDNFTAIEQGQGHTVMAGYLSGRPPRGGELSVGLRLNGTAVDTDVSITTRVRVLSGVPLSSVTISLRVDGISQEVDETFSIEFLDLPLTNENFFPEEVPVTIGHLNGTILDQDRINFQLAEDDFFQQEELNAMMEIRILRDQGIRLANPVRFKVTPLTVGEAIRRGIVANSTLPADDVSSPSRADTSDFNATAFEVTLRSNESLTGVTVLISIMDDEIDEADMQFFITSLEIVDAVNRDLITILRTNSTCIIVDNDDTRIGFAQFNYTFLEPDSETTIREVTLIREGGSLSEQEFSVAIFVGDPGGTTRSATLKSVESNNDYSVLGNIDNFVILPFPASAESITFEFSLFADDLPEGLEAFSATSTPNEGSPNFQSPLMMGPRRAFATTEIQILDNDDTIVGFVRPNYTISESGGSQQVCVQLFDPDENDTLGFSIFLAYETRTGSADESDYTTEDQPFVTFFNAISNGMPRVVCFDISITDDLIYEDVESFTITLELDPIFGMQFGVVIDPSVTTIFVEDNDVLVFSFEPAEHEFSEDAGDVSLSVSLVQGNLGEFTIVVITATDDNSTEATAFAGSDYESVEAAELTYSSTSSSSQSFLVTINTDDLTELREFFEAVITGTFILRDSDGMELPLSLQESSRISVLIPRAQVFITDINTAIIGFEPVVYDVSEGADEVFFNFTVLEGNIAFPVNVMFFTSDGSAIGGPDMDYDSVSTEFAITGTESVSTPVKITNDDELEGPENFFGNLAAGSGAENFTNIMFNPIIATANIIDDDDIVIGFVPDTYVVNETTGVITFFVEIISGQLSGEVVVEFSTESGSAEAGQDYMEIVTPLTFGRDQMRVAVSVVVIDDDLSELDETFFGTLGLPASSTSSVQFIPERANATILDNDVAVIGFVQSYEVIEGVATSVAVDISLLSGMLGRSVEVTVFTADDTALAPGDYSQSSQTFTFSQTDFEFSINVAIADDLILEQAEIFFVRAVLDNPADATGVLIDPEETTVTIEDNDIVVIGFLPDEYIVDESAGSVNFIVEVISGTLAFDVVVEFFTEDGSAQDPDDYTGTVIPLTFGPGRTSLEVSVPVIDDDLLEDLEMFFGNLRFPSGEEVPMVQFAPSRASATVTDNDVAVIGFLQDYTVTEGVNGSVSVDIQLLSGQLQRLVEVRVFTVDGSALGPGDYITQSELLTFTPTQTEFSVNIIIVNDAILEPQESFIVQAELVSTDAPGVQINPDQSAVTIDDDEVVTITFEEPVYNATELSTMAVVCLIKNPETPDPIIIDDITTSPGTATAGEDYSPGPFSVTFGTGANDRQCINIPLLADNLAEPTEDFTVSLNLPSAANPMVFPGTIPSAVVNIMDSGNQQTVNDTVIGDPLFTVPILVPEEQLAALNLTRISLCYEIHGSSDQWFNLVTDECATVNAKYFSLSPRLNVIDEIGVRAVDDSNQCVNIRVNVNNCTAEVNGVLLDLMERYSSNGINVRRYNNRVRISVPNCNELTLVMWAICEMRTLDNPDVPGTELTGKMIKYVVMRGLNFGHRAAHGLIGQFWNIPVEVTPFNGQLRDGSRAEGLLILNMTSLDKPRAYAGWLYDLTWEFEDGPCLYVGDRQSGPLYEVINPNDGVIEKIYQEYKVDSAFSEENYIFGLFSEDRCGSGLPAK